MVALPSFLALLFSALLVRTSPVSFEFDARSQVYSHYWREKFGVSVGSDVTRFVVKYANAQRWKQSTAVGISEILNLHQQVPTFPSYFVRPSSTNPIYRTFLPLAPIPAQVQRLRTAFISSCTFRTPLDLAVTLPLSYGSLSTSSSLVASAQRPFQDSWWIIHKRFRERSYNQWRSARRRDTINHCGCPIQAWRSRGLSVVMLTPLLTSVQLGFMAPNGEVNLAVNDIINALKFLRTGVLMIGGDASKITIAGQSSGGTMVRALLAIPLAQSLFRSAILQSDPMVMSFRGRL